MTSLCKDESPEPCLFCDQLLLLSKSLHGGGASCQLKSQFMKIMSEKKENLRAGIHTQNEELQDVFDSLEVDSKEPLLPLTCKFCGEYGTSSVDKYTRHLNQHYEDVYVFFQKHYSSNVSSLPPGSPLMCPICLDNYNQEKDDSKGIRSWVSKHFYECGDPLRREKLELMASKALFSKCEWCDVPILHRGDLEAHQGNCPKRVTLGEVETKGASMDGPLRRLLLESSKDCLGCQRHADLLRRADVNRLDWAPFVKHVYANHSGKLDDADMSFEEFCYFGELLEMQFLSLGIESSSLKGPSPQKNPKSPLVDGSLRRSESIRIRKMKKKSHAGGLSCLACQSCS